MTLRQQRRHSSPFSFDASGRLAELRRGLASGFSPSTLSLAVFVFRLLTGCPRTSTSRTPLPFCVWGRTRQRVFRPPFRLRVEEAFLVHSAGGFRRAELEARLLAREDPII